MRQYRWYGWGSTDRNYTWEDRPRAWKFLCSVLELRGDEKFPVCNVDDIELRHVRIDLKELQQLAFTDASRYSRILHSYGKSYRDLIRLRRGEISNPPDAVIYPDNEDQVQRIINYCAEHNYALFPYGGGSSVVGGIESRDPRISLSLDLKKMNRVIAIDEISQTAIIEPGIWGPDLESYLNTRGFTLGQFPWSFEYSTLGGWIATRGASFTSKYGLIEQITHGLQMATPTGFVQTQHATPRMPGPSLLQMLIGSEGTLGVITQATMQLHALSPTTDYRAMIFRNFADGITALREIYQSDLVPTTIQLLDENATRCFLAFRKQTPSLKDWVETSKLQALNMLGYSFEYGALLLLGFEGDNYTVNAIKNHVMGWCQAYGAFELGAELATLWLADRYEDPFLRDALLDHGVLMDMLEVTTSWRNLQSLYKNLTSCLNQLTQKTGSRSLVSTRISHGYRDGVSLVVTFMTPVIPQREIAQWEYIRHSAILCITESGGMLSSHHGVGYEHIAWLKQELGSFGYDVLLSLKKRLDPQNIMSPGKLILPVT